MVSHEEAKMQEHEKLTQLMQQIRSAEIKLTEAKTQVSDWRKIETQHQNEVNRLKKEAKEISDRLFSEPKRHPEQDWSPAG